MWFRAAVPVRLETSRRGHRQKDTGNRAPPGTHRAKFGRRHLVPTTAAMYQRIAHPKFSISIATHQRLYRCLHLHLHMHRHRHRRRWQSQR